MATKSASASNDNIVESMQRAMVCMFRFSTALALYSVTNMQTALSMRREEGIPKAMEDMERVLESMTDRLAGQMENSNREAMKSASQIADQMFQPFNMVD